tara:strand:+ start:720 stop:1058 length:339 start_codon:yes stop_codon:yes gene_type:complete
MKRALILDNIGKEVMTVNEDYDTINIIIPERPSKYGNKPAMEYQIKGKELLKELHKFIGGVIQNNTAVNKLKEEIKELQDQSLKSISGSKESKELSDKIKLIRNKYQEIIKR